MNRIGNIEVNTPPEGYKQSLKSRLIVTAVLLVILIPAFVLGGWYFFFVIMGFLLVAILEVIKAPRKKYNWTVYVVTYVIILSLVYWMFFKQNLVQYAENPVDYTFSLEDYYSRFEASIIGVAVSLFVYCIEGIVDKNFGFDDVAYFFFMSLLVGIGFQAFYFLRYFPFSVAFGGNSGMVNWGSQTYDANLLASPVFKFLGSCELMVYAVLGPIFNDIFAYFGGIYFGKHKLNERISPKKTWEGFYFGWIFGFITCFLFAIILAWTGYPILPFLTIDKWYWIIFISLILPLFGDVGDLTFSMIKRFFKIKDYSNILGGHGGILDRIDSIIFASIGIVIVLIFINNDWNFLI